VERVFFVLLTVREFAASKWTAFWNSYLSGILISQYPASFCLDEVRAYSLLKTLSSTTVQWFVLRQDWEVLGERTGRALGTHVIYSLSL
jgi:hypothetical protein